MSRNLRNTAGYTIDQTILIVAIIAILVTLIIITVGWQLINKTSGTKLASQVRQIEDAVGQFYSTYRMWPQNAYSAPTTNPENNFRALAGTVDGFTYVGGTSGSGTLNGITVKNFAPGFQTDTNGGIHTLGGGGVVTLHEVSNPFAEYPSQRFAVVQLTRVPYAEASEADRAIDGGSVVDFAAGRLQASADGVNCATAAAPAAVTETGNRLLTVCYAANLLQ